jgi:hypothetical protein
MASQRLTPRPKTAAPIYGSPEWRSLIAGIIRERGRRCEDPKCKTPGRTGMRVFGDHIRELGDDGALLDPRLAAIERVVRETALKLWALDQTVTEIVAKLTVVGEMPVITPREGVAAVRQSRREKIMAALARREQEGRRRDAVNWAARKFANDPDDDGEVKNLERSIRRWRERIPDIVRIPAQKSNRG